MTRRLIAGLLTLCMLVSLCPPNAFALRSSAAVVPETESTVVETEATEATDPTEKETEATDPTEKETEATDPTEKETEATDPTEKETEATDPTETEPEEKEPNYRSVTVGKTITLTASSEAGGTWSNTNNPAATALGRIDDAGRAVADVFGVAEGSTTVTYTVGDEKEVWKITVTAAPAEETPAEEEPADVTYSVSRYLEEKASEGSEVPFTYTQIDTISVTGKPGAEVTLPAVSGAIAVDTDADYIFPYEDGTAALTLPAETPEDLTLSVYYVKTEALPEINDFDLEVPDSTAYHTYYFYDVETDGEPVEAWTQIVTNGDTLRLPAAPAKENAKFTGWYANGTRIGDSYAQVTINNVTKDETINVRPQFEDVGYVFFLDKKGAVCHTAEGKPGEKMADNEFALAKAAASGSLEPDDSIQGWKNGASDVTSVTFKAGIITLSPDVQKGFWVTFDVDGGEYMAPVFCKANTTLTLETPVKPGYVFDGWYMEGVAESVTSVSSGANLTAHWSASSETNYTVIHWLENADDENYTYFRSEVKQGTTGTQTEAAAIPSGDSKFEDRKYYDVQTITQQTIAGDGSTIVNVYYNRKTYTVTYKDVPVKCNKPEHKHSVEGGCYELTCDKWWLIHSHSVLLGCYDLICTKEEHSHSDDGTETRTVTAKWGANIADTWPGGNFKVQSTGKHQASIDVMPKYNETFTLDTAVPDENAKDVSSAGYWLQKIESNNKDDFANGYTEDDVDRISGTDWSISAEDSYPITGFTFYKYVTKSGEGKAYNGAKFYYTRNTYNITLLYKDGTNVQNPISYKYEQTVNPLPTDLTAPAGTPEGYKFAGWFADPEGTQEFELPKTMPARGLTAYAVWKAEPVNATVHFSVTMNGATRTLTVPYGSTLAEAPGYNEMLVDLAKANGNKELAAWCKEDGTLFDVNTKLYSPVTLKPMFAGDAVAYTVTYKEDGKDPIQDTQTYKSGSYAKAKEPEVLLDSNGNYFSGWTDDNDNTYQPGEAIEIAGNVTLTAVYKAPPARTYIVYHSNFGTDAKYSVGPYMVNAKVPSLAAYPTDKLPDHEKDGYKFVGWSLTPDGSEAIDQVVIKGNEHNDLYAIWVKAEFDITYAYTGTLIPDGANKQLPKATKGTMDDTITVADAPSVPGYTFSGWTTTTADVTVADDGTFIMPASDVAFTGSWEVDPKQTKDLTYTVEYYKDNVKVEADTQTVKETVQVLQPDTMTVDKTKINTSNKYTGYRLDRTDPTPIPDTVTNGDTIKVYYVKDTFGYTVEYYYDGVKDDSKTENLSATFGDVINSYADKVIDGYKFDHDTGKPLTITSTAANNVISVYYVKDTFGYTVEYYYDGVKDDSKTENLSATFGDVINSYADKVIDGYKFDHDTGKPLTITSTAANNVISVYYVKDTFGYTVEYYYDGVKDDSKTENLSATFGDVINSYADKVIDGYKFDHDTGKPLTITSTAANNVISVYYVKDTFGYTVEYYYDGVKDDSKTENLSATFGDVINSYADKVIDGYKFDHDTGKPLTITSTAANNVISVYYVKDSFGYTVEYYYDGVKDDSKTENLSATFGDVINSYTDKVIDGYKFDHDTGKPLTITSTAANNVISVYYVKDTFGYTVEYYYDGVKDDSKTENLSATFGDVINSYTDKVIDGYKFDHDTGKPLTITSTAANNVISVYYVKDTFGYTVEYYYDGVKDDSKTETGTAEYQSQITDYTDKAGEGYALDYVENLPLTITEVAANNVIKVYYATDEIGVEDPDEPDGVPDKYQATVTYTAVNGSVDLDKAVVTLYDEDGKPSETGKGYLSESQIATATADTGYKANDPLWNNTPSTTLAITGDITLTATFVKDSFGYTVEYYYDGVKDDSKTENLSATFGDVINSYADKVIDGYKFDHDTGKPLTITSTAANNVISVYYVKDSFGYTVEYYYDGVKDDSKTENLSATFGDVINSYTDKVIDGYKFDHDTGKPLTITSTAANNVISVYYVKDTFGYTVEYYYDGVKDDSKTENLSATFGDVINSYTDKVIDGYKFDHDTGKPLTITSTAANNVISVYYVKDTFGYTVEYYYDGVKDDSKTENLSATFGDVINSYTDKVIDGYKFDHDTGKPLTITSTAANNVISVYYVKDTFGYTVEYYYDGVKDDSKTENLSATFGDVINSYTDKVIDGYKFDHDTGKPLTITSTAANNVISVYYVKDTFGYTVEYYYDGVKDDSKTENLSATFGDVINSYTDKVIDGYKFDHDTGKPLTITSTAANNVISVYYVKDSFGYTVEYYYDGVKDDSKTENLSATFGDVINSYTDKVIDGYKFDHDTGKPLTITSTAANNVISVYYVKDSFGYTVEYYYDGVKDDSKTETGTAEYQSQITDYTDKAGEGYALDYVENLPLTITEVAANNVIKVYYATDEIGVEDPDEPDGVPDKYQATVTYTAVNGSVDLDKAVVTLYDEDGKPSETGKGYLSESQIATATADTGYKANDPLWDTTPSTTLAITGDITLTATFVKRTDLTYTVNYYWNGTTESVAKSVIREGKTFMGIYSEEPIAVDGCTPVSNAAQEITVKADKEKDVINFYYYKNVELTANSGVRVYNGSMQTITGYTSAPEGVTFDGVTASGSGKDVSVTPYEVTFSDGTVGKVDTSSKYIVTAANPGTLTIVRQSINPTDPPIPTDPDGEKPIDPDQSYYGGVEVKAPENVKYNGQLQEQKPAVTDKDGTALVENTDYTLSYSEDTVNAGTVTVTVTGKGNYQGKVEVTYQITKRTVTLTSEGGSKVYDGTPLTKPGVVVGGDGFVEGEVTAINATGTVTNVTEGKVKNAITYTEGTGFKAGNYEITKVEGELYVTKAKEGIVTVTGKSATYVWTGDEREVTGFTHDGAARLITVELKKGAEAAARGTAVGTYAMGLKAENFTASSPNYETVKVVVVDGELVIETINITVTVTVRGNKETVTFDGDPHTVTGYKVISAIANTGMDMGMDGFTLTLKGTASATGTEVGTYNMGLTAGDFTITSDIYRVVRVVVEDGGLEITPAPEEITEPTEEIPDETVPLAPPEEDNIPDEPVPQAGPAWALINLILSILTVLASLLLLVGYFGKKEEEAEDENGNAILDAEGNNVMNDIKKRGGWRLASLVPAILSVIAFLLTENMRNPMILVDRWTLLMVIIAVVQVLVMLLSKKKTEDNTQEA